MFKLRLMSKPLFYCFGNDYRETSLIFKCFSPASTMRPLQIIADPLKIKGQVLVVHHAGVTNPELNEEIEEEVGDTIALSFPKMKVKRDV